jgi:two-component system cell cycle sensor histidine kinase PleC
MSITGSLGFDAGSTLLEQYSTRLSEAVLLNRARTAENSARAEAALANRVKSEFISNMSHELRTPLNTVLGFAKLLNQHDQRRLSDDEIVEYAQLIQNAATHLLNVINDILDLSKIQSGRYTLDAGEVKLSEVVHTCVATFHHGAKEAELTLKQSIAEDLPYVRGDAGKLRQVLAALISNAIKFTRPGGTIAVEANRAKSGAVVVVRDNGIGMSKEEVRVALTPFGQVDGGRARWREGTGLGLPIAKALVELHGGRLKVDSTPGVGTTVSIFLPTGEMVS